MIPIFFSSAVRQRCLICYMLTINDEHVIVRIPPQCHTCDSNFKIIPSKAFQITSSAPR